MELSKVNSWFKLDEMQHNIKKTKHLLIDTAQKLYHTEITTLELSIDNARLEESVGEKRLGVVIDSHLIRKLNSKICLPKRATVYLTIECRKCYLMLSLGQFLSIVVLFGVAVLLKCSKAATSSKTMCEINIGCHH